jgi:hypothetical protein
MFNMPKKGKIGDPHGDVKPVHPVLAIRMQIRLQVAQIVTAIGEKDHLLVFLVP